MASSLGSHRERVLLCRILRTTWFIIVRLIRSVSLLK